MKKIELLGLDQEVYYDKISNGLNILLIPLENKKTYYVDYFTKYGSVNLNFLDENDNEYLSPKGIAHFLEHKMFETESGEDPFAFFSKSGTECNACTGYDKTSYYIAGINNLNENLEYLINYVNEPYFTDENVEKEKGIIIEEILMYDDEPDWILEEEIHKAVFINNPIKYDIAGYPDTVNKIKKEDLYKCYNMFYQPSNMMLVISGKFDLEEVFNIISNNKLLNSRNEIIKINEIKKEEPDNVNYSYKEIECSKVAIPKIAIDFKLSLKDKNNLFMYYMYISSIVDLIFGSGTSFKEDMFEKGFATYIANNLLYTGEHLVIEFYIEGNNPKEILNEIIDRFMNYNITNDELNRYKKILISTTVMNSDDVQGLAERLIHEYIVFGDFIFNKIDMIKKLNYDEFNKIRNELVLSNNSTVILKPKKTPC